MGVITKNGDNIIDFDLFTEKYGCIKVDFKQQEGARYYLYAFRNDLAEWDFDKGELVLITHDENKVKEISLKILTIHVGEFFCKECFRKKTSKNYLIKIQVIGGTIFGKRLHYKLRNYCKVKFCIQ